MAVIKCKMCGGDLILEEGSNVAECEYCGTRQTVPTADNEKKMNLFARANRLRANNEFDKAAGVYESIVADFPEEAEAYWGLILCKYGIEYVDDPGMGKKIPTCHRSSFESLMDDQNFELVMEYADPIARRVYREEAKQIEELRKGIIEVSSHEEPYDIFICYKETAEDGQRTLDSVLAQDVYEMLTENGYRVFFSRVSLEDKLGVEYEPYIFAALNSAKIMLAFGTDYDYYNAVWVKNEWSRFLQLIAKGEKKVLIPCYKNIDAYDMPKEFAKLQAQDMGKVGAMQDLLRGIKKILPKESLVATQSASQQVIAHESGGSGPNVTALLKRGNMSLEDHAWEKAKDLFDQILSIDPENHYAYLGLAMANAELQDRDALRAIYADRGIKNSSELQRARQFAKGEQAAWWQELDQERQAADERKEENKRRLAARRRQLAPLQNLIAAGEGHTVGLMADGSMVSTEASSKTGNDPSQHTFSDWTDIAAVAAGKCCKWTKFGGGIRSDTVEFATVVLKMDGTVAKDGIAGSISAWKDIIAIAVGYDHTVGLNRDGSVVAASICANNPKSEKNRGQCNVSDWMNIVAIAAGFNHTVGLKADGTVFAVGDNGTGECDVSDWTDIVAISAGTFHTVGLKSDGAVVATKYTGDQKNYCGQCEISGWTDIVAIAAGGRHTVGLKSDGTAVAVGKNDCGQCDVSSWTDIVAISAGARHTVGLKADGSLVATEYKGDREHDFGQCDISDWRLFRDFETLEQERKEAVEQRTIRRNLYEAINNGDRAAIDSCFLTEIDPDFCYEEKLERVPLIICAIKQKDAETVKMLLQRGANPNCERVFKDGQRFSALRDSIIEWPNDEIAQILIDAGADVNYVETAEELKVPVLIDAIIKQNVGMVKTLLAKGADPNCERVFKDGCRFSALRDSIFEWPNDEIAQMLIDAGADVNYVETNDGCNIPVLINAICEKNVGMVKTLLDKGADPNCERVFKDGRCFSALRDSIIGWPNDEIAQMLIDAGANVNYVETGEKLKVPVLIDAICKKNVGMVKTLLEHGANPNCKRIFHNGKTYSALRDSILEWPNDRIAVLLLDAGARFEPDELQKAKIVKEHFSKETLARFKKAGWRPSLF